VSATGEMGWRAFAALGGRGENREKLLRVAKKK